MHAIGVHQKAVADNLEREAKELEELVPMRDALDDPGNDASEAERDRQSVVEVCGRWKAKGQAREIGKVSRGATKAAARSTTHSSIPWPSSQ